MCFFSKGPTIRVKYESTGNKRGLSYSVIFLLIIFTIVVVTVMFLIKNETYRVSLQDNSQEILNEFKENHTAYMPSGESKFAFLGGNFGDIFASLVRKYGDVKVIKTTGDEVAMVLKAHGKSYLIDWICSEEDCLLQSVTEDRVLYQREKALKMLDMLQSE